MIKAEIENEDNLIEKIERGSIDMYAVLHQARSAGVIALWIPALLATAVRAGIGKPAY